MLVKANQLYDPSVKDLVNPENTYAIIEIFYTNYKKEPFNNVVFDTDRYVKRNGKDYLPADPYNSFKIFMGSSGL